MNSFIDIKLLLDPEIPVTTLMNALFLKFHRNLAHVGPGDIGISFPEFKEERKSLGARLRLHGTTGALQKFIGVDWLSGLRDHVSVGQLEPVPSDVRYRIVRRVQAKSSPERERRRLMARKGISDEDARAAIPDSSAEMLKLPFILVKSSSTGQQFRLFIEHLPLQGHCQLGTFNAYGLSAGTTVPWF